MANDDSIGKGIGKQLAGQHSQMIRNALSDIITVIGCQRCNIRAAVAGGLCTECAVRAFVERFIAEAPSERATYDDYWRNKWCDLADEAAALLASVQTTEADK